MCHRFLFSRNILPDACGLPDTASEQRSYWLQLCSWLPIFGRAGQQHSGSFQIGANAVPFWKGLGGLATGSFSADFRHQELI